MKKLVGIQFLNFSTDLIAVYQYVKGKPNTMKNGVRLFVSVPFLCQDFVAYIIFYIIKGGTRRTPLINRCVLWSTTIILFLL